MIYIADTETFAYDYIAVFKNVETGHYTVFHNDPEGIKNFIEQPNAVFGFFNGKNYDRFIIGAICNDGEPQVVKMVNDWIIAGNNGWEYPEQNLTRCWFDMFDLMDDMQQGLSLKAIEAHLGLDIEESEVDFNINRPLTQEELAKVIKYCKCDVDASEKVYNLRQDYLNNKITLGKAKGLSSEKSLYMTNAKLTAVYLDAQPKVFNDERDYQYPNNLFQKYIPKEVFEFFDGLQHESISDDDVFKRKLSIKIGDCPIVIGFGGIHGAIPNYVFRESDNGRIIRNYDVASYYPHLMTLYGYTSRAIPNPQIYADMLKTRIQAKKSGDKATANALKLVANTTYGATLNRYNDLYDPLKARSVCITGQLFLLELAEHLHRAIPNLTIVQLNTDGIMIEYDNVNNNGVQEILKEWQERTGFDLEEDKIKAIFQKDVNNYIEIPYDGERKIKGGYLVKGLSQAGAFNINNNTPIVAKALQEYLVNNVPIEETINKCNDLLQFQLIAKASSKYNGVYHIVDGEKIPTQKCNRVYATTDTRYGTLYKIHKETGGDAKIAGLPEHCLIDNKNVLSIDVVDKEWYIKLAKKQVNDFLGIKPKKVNKRKITTLKKQLLKFLEE